jgi:predicted ATPase
VLVAKTPTRSAKEAPTTLERLHLHGFKSARDEVAVDIRPLTILAGQNSAGKSTIVQPLLLMKQTLEASHDPGVLELNGTCVKFNDASQMFWRGRSKEDRANEWTISMSFGQESIEIKYGLRAVDGRGRGGGVCLLQTKYIVRGSELLLRAESSQADLKRGLDVTQPVNLTTFLPANLKPLYRAVEERCAHRLDMEVERAGPQAGHPLMATVARPFPVELIEAIIHLPGLRGNPERAYAVTRVADRYPGPFSPYVASVLLDWADTDDDRLDRVASDLRRLGLTWKVAPKRIDDTHVEIRVARLPRPQHGGAHDLVNIVDVGFGASQVLAVVVALHAARPGQLVHIEQPELHLHPNAQVVLAELLLEAASRGVRVVAETHSSVLLKRTQTMIARGENGVTSKLVALHWFTRDDDGASHVVTADLDDDGSYGDWPVDFADVEMSVEKDFINASLERHLS